MYDKTNKTSITTNTNNNIQSPQIISTKSKTVSKTTTIIVSSPQQPTTPSHHLHTQVDREVDDTRESIDTMSATTTPTLDTRAAANEAETDTNSEVLSPDTPRFSQFMDYITGSATSETAQADTTTNDADNASAKAQSSSLPAQPSYDPTNYQYKNRYATLTNPNYTKSLNSKTKVGKRCYRLNIERPFDIHCEQSPLEYGDYMAPWTKEVYPKTVGPTEYCPPRHLGGEQVAWRELMRWSASAAGCEEKVNSLDVLDEAEDIEGEVEAIENFNSIDIIDEEEKQGSLDELEQQQKNNPASPTGGWRELTSTELSAVQKLGEINPKTGELTFQTYDLSHVALNTAGTKTALPGDTSIITDSSTGQAGLVDDNGIIQPLHTVFSMDSTTSEDEKLNPKTDEEIANATARLFRRSNLSMKEKEEKAKKEMERLEAVAAAREAAARQSGLDVSTSTRRGGKGSRRFSSKKLLRSISRTFSSNVNNTSNTSGGSENWRGSSSRRSASSMRSSASGGGSERPGMDGNRRGSTQALAIDKARDVADESDDEEGSFIGDDDADEAEKKPQNVALFILGDYDTLNDLVKDGAKRLRDDRDSSDLDILLQNEPCPPPNRWVRPTGWGKCNPSSMYAKNPPSDFDWVKYYDKLRLKTSEYKKLARSNKSKVVAEPQDKPTTDTQDTETTVAVALSSSSDLSEDEHHHSSSGRLIKVTRAGVVSTADEQSTSIAAPQSGTSSSVAPRGGKSHFNKSTSDSISQSARVPRSTKVATRSASDTISASANTPRRSRMFGRRKS